MNKKLLNTSNYVEDVKLNGSETLSKYCQQNIQSIVTCFHKSNITHAGYSSIVLSVSFFTTNINLCCDGAFPPLFFFSATLSLWLYVTLKTNTRIHKKNIIHINITLAPYPSFTNNKYMKKKSLLLHLFCHLNVN